jgi:tetratricopeptide (TPR) repeat protein
VNPAPRHLENVLNGSGRMTRIRRLAIAVGLGASLTFAPAPGAAQVILKPGVTVRSLEAAVARDSNDTEALYGLALGYWSKKRWNDAERLLRQTLAIEPRNAPALLALAHLPYARRPKLWDEDVRGEVPPEWQTALILSERYTRLAMQIDPLVDLQIVGAVAPDPDAMLRGADPGSVERNAMVGQANFQNARYDQAYAWLNQFARLLGEEVDSARVPDFVLWFRGLSAAHLNDFPTALRDFRALHARGPGRERTILSVDHVDGTYVLAWLEQHTGSLDAAAALYQEALTRDFGLWMAHVQLARIYEDRQEWNDAIRERRLAVDADPEDPSLLLDLGITLYRAGRADQAAPILAQARSGLPRNYRVPYYEGYVARDLARPDDAREAFRRFLALVPSRYTGEIAEVRGRLHELP